MLGIPSYIKVKKQYQSTVDIIIFIFILIFLLIIIYFIYYKTLLWIHFIFKSKKIENNYFDFYPHNCREEIEKNYIIKGHTHQNNVISITGFVYIKDWKYKYFQTKNILNETNNNISIYLDEIKNNIVFNIKTSEGERKIFKIKGIFINKWFHFAIIIKDLQIELYYNGKVYASFLMKSLPNLSLGDLIFCKNTGFNGLLFDFNIYQKALNHILVYKLSRINPPLNEKYFKDK